MTMDNIFSDVEIIANDYTIFELKGGTLTLATHIKNILDSKLFSTYEEAINSVMDMKYEKSLMYYLVKLERYEDAHFLQQAYKAIFIKAATP